MKGDAFETKTIVSGPKDKRRTTIAKLAVGLVVLTIVLLPFLGPMIAQTIIDTHTYTLYQSPEGGESLTVGVWRFDEVTLPISPWDVHCMYQLQVEVLDWDGSSEQMDMLTIFTNTTTYEEFTGLNETQKDEIRKSNYPSVVPDRTTIGGGFFAFQTTGTHLWGIKFAPAEGYAAKGYVQAFITLIVRYE